MDRRHWVRPSGVGRHESHAHWAAHGMISHMPCSLTLCLNYVHGSSIETWFISASSPIVTSLRVPANANKGEYWPPNALLCIQEFPIKSQLKVNYDPTSAITEEHIKDQLEGMSVSEVMLSLLLALSCPRSLSFNTYCQIRCPFLTESMIDCQTGFNPFQWTYVIITNL